MTSSLKALRLTVVAAAAILLPGCGGSDSTSSDQANVQQFCEVTAKLDREGARIFNKLQNNKLGHKVLLRKQQAYLKRNAELLDQAQQVAPDEISDDVATLIAESRSSAGEGPAVDPHQLAEAQAAVDTFRQKNCKGATAPTTPPPAPPAGTS